MSPFFLAAVFLEGFLSVAGVFLAEEGFFAEASTLIIHDDTHVYVQSNPSISDTLGPNKTVLNFGGSTCTCRQIPSTVPYGGVLTSECQVHVLSSLGKGHDATYRL